MGNRHPTIVPYETFEAADGDFVVAVGNDEQWRRFCAVLKLDALAADDRFSTNRVRLANYDTLRPILGEMLRARTRAEWVGELKKAGVPCGSVRDVAEVLQDPQLDARGMIQQVEHAVAGALRVTGVPIKLSNTPGAVRTAPPVLGQHTESILSLDVGLTPEEIEDLRASRVV
jgi:crotonobetainyl-CoA:carnitine CoA-transferase CaiB-like acyl-CoA transferase